MQPLTIHFYPGHFPPTQLDPATGAKFGAGLLVVLRGKTVLYRCPAWGGPSERIIDAVGVPATPTPAGVFNPFGPLAVRFFKDLNNNGVLDAREKLQGEMLHTTPESHAAADSTTVNPGNSHGCIHLTIEYRDALLGMGALKAGVKLVIHSYSEHYGSG